MPNNKNNTFDELKDAENPTAPLMQLSDTEKYNKLYSIKQSLLSVDHAYKYISVNFIRCMGTTCTYSLSSTIIGTVCMTGTSPDSPIFKIGIAALISSAISWTATFAPCFSSRYRAYLLAKIDKPLSLPADFNLNELNTLLLNVGINPIEEKNISSTKHLKNVCQTIQSAIEQTDTFKLFALGEAIKNALPLVGFFSDRNRLILSYLIPSEEVLNELAPHPTKKIII